MDTGLAGKVALITGATRNHGRASALAFAREGANLLICTRESMGLLEETAHLASAYGVRVVTLQCDITDEDDVNAFVVRGLREFGRIDVVVNNAGWRVRQPFLEITEEVWDRSLKVNVHAPFIVSKAAIPSMMRHKWGRIINYSGMAPFGGGGGQGPLKLACIGLTRAIAREYGKYNITANCIAPGYTKVEVSPGQEVAATLLQAYERSPIPRQGTVEECGALVVFLASEWGAYITGQHIAINGGAHFV